MFQDIVTLVEYERTQQDNKWGNQHRTPELWTAIEAEELGEAAKAGLDYNAVINRPQVGPLPVQIAAQEMLEEWIQVAAVAFAAIEDIAEHWPGGEISFYDLTIAALEDQVKE